MRLATDGGSGGWHEGAAGTAGTAQVEADAADARVQVPGGRIWSAEPEPSEAAAPGVAALLDDAPLNVSPLTRAARQGTYSLATLELDAFTAVREVQGELSACEILDYVEGLLASVLRGTDMVARRDDGGFVILLRNTPAAGAVRALEKAMRALQGDPFHLSNGRVESLTASVGVAGSDEAADDEISPESMLSDAERHAESAHLAGGGRIHWSGGEVMPAEATIVLLEDDVVTAGLIRHRLSRKGHRVVHIADGTDALSRIADETPSLIILDLNMGGLGGIGAIGRIRLTPALRKVPIMVLSKVESETDVIRSFQLGADEFVQKPFSTPEVVSRVQRLLRGR